MNQNVLKTFIGKKDVIIETANGKTFKGKIIAIDDIGLLVNKNIPSTKINRNSYYICNNIVSIT